MGGFAKSHEGVSRVLGWYQRSTSYCRANTSASCRFISGYGNKINVELEHIECGMDVICGKSHPVIKDDLLDHIATTSKHDLLDDPYLVGRAGKADQ